MSAALVTLSGVDKLTAVARQVVRDTPAPEPCFVSLDVRMSQIDIQPSGGRDPVEALGTLLVWTHTLTGITGTWFCTRDGDLFITLAGRGPSGVQVRVYSSIPFDGARGYVTRPADGGESVTPDELYQLALSIREGQ
ncbi:hypothetical protein OG439_32555 [Amycolatopsis sp. NBC_01307]|uniref:hypothetical protein n=1 Tax=Amycolatopsis sp. NBC_01307 TaxID=2903561 RepID=UPI002E0F5FE4|nr:hypothetical protein OG439_32555 [Amycolatopsis sp. NBC_01307]